MNISNGNSNTIDTLNDLIETSKDGEYGFRTSAENMKATDMRSLFEQRAEECRSAAAELQTLVQQAGGNAEDSGSTSGAMHRGWVSVKATLAGYTDQAILEETERGENLAMQSYAKALQESLPAEARQVVERQYEGVKRNLMQVRSLLQRTGGSSTAS